MLFPPLAAPRSVRWRPLDGEGLEHLRIRPDRAGMRVRSAVIGSFGGTGFGALYSIALDEHWLVHEFRVESVDGRVLSLRSPEPGRWVEENGTPRPDLDGCIDIDLSATPFTNTLPIRRLGLVRAQGEVALTMLYVPFDTFEPVPDTQYYRAVEDGRLYRFENDTRTFAADLPLDGDGLVLDYPALFRRC